MELELRLSGRVVKGERSGLLTHRNDGNRFVVHADEKLTAFLELERAIHEFVVDLMSYIILSFFDSSRQTYLTGP